MAFPRLLLKSLGSKWGEHVKRDRAPPVCLGTDRPVCPRGGGRFAYRCVCLLCACPVTRVDAPERVGRAQGTYSCYVPVPRGGKARADNVNDGRSFAVVQQRALVSIPSVSEREGIYRAAETLNSLIGLWLLSSSLF